MDIKYYYERFKQKQNSSKVLGIKTEILKVLRLETIKEMNELGSGTKHKAEETLNADQLK